MTAPGPDHELEELLTGREVHEPGSVDWRDDDYTDAAVDRTTAETDEELDEIDAGQEVQEVSRSGPADPGAAAPVDVEDPEAGHAT